jgi:hypothetical protein
MFDIKKFFSGFNITDGEKAGKIIFYVIIISACLIVYNLMTRPQQVQRITVQKGAVQTGGKLEIGGQKQEQKAKNWFIGGIIESDKTIGVIGGKLF